jgi:DUF1680 family protein
MNPRTADEAIINNIPLNDFKMDQVIVTDEYYNNAFAQEIRYLKSFNPDRLLAGFLENKGLPEKDEKYPGWESTEIRGHTLGHFLTASSQVYINTKDEEILNMLDYMMEQLSHCQFESGYISAFPETLFDNVENNQPAWVPWYTLHKLLLGILDVYNVTQSQTAYQIVMNLGEWVYHRTSNWSSEVHARVLSIEYGGMNDALYKLFKITGDPNHLEAAHMFDELTLFTPIQQGKDILKGRHANTTIPKFLGAINRYKLLGETEVFYLEACIQFWDLVVNHHSYITGGNSEWEHFGDPDILDGERSNFNCETCNSYNMLKLTRELFKITRDAKYADFYENILINSIMSSQNPVTGMTMYFQPMATGYFKVYSAPFEHFWCCTGTGMENFTKLNDSIYFHSVDGIYVNQFISSILTWEENQVKLTQTTLIPRSDTVQFDIHTFDKVAKELAIHVRVPHWSAGELEVTINDSVIQCQVEDNYVLIDRLWKDGDIVSIRIPMKVSYSSLPDRKSVVGFKYGPIVLSAGLGQENMVQSQTGVNVSVPTRNMLIKDFLTVKETSVAHWFEHIEQNLVRRGDEMAFVLRNTDEDDRLVFTPHYQQHSERYGIYWRFVEADSDELIQHLAKNKQNQRLEDATVDCLPIGNDQYELEHVIKGERTSVGAWDGFNYRRADANGWFSYCMKVTPDTDHYLLAKYYKGTMDRPFDIFVDGQLLVNELIMSGNKRGLINKHYLIPAAMIQDKQLIEISFIAKEEAIAIYDLLRTVKAEDYTPQYE